MKNRETQMWIQKYQLSFPITEEEEDRSCLAVQFAWDWDQFPVAVDGDHFGITIVPTELENVKQFNEEFVPQLNRELCIHGFKPTTAQRTYNELYIDLDNPEAVISGMEARKALAQAGLTVDEIKAIPHKGLIDKMREKYGRFYHYDTTTKLINWGSSRP